MTPAGQLRAPKRQIDGAGRRSCTRSTHGFSDPCRADIIQPEHYGVLVVLPLLLAALGLSLRSSPRGR